MASGKRVSSKDLKAGAFADPAEKVQGRSVGLKPGLTRWFIALPLPIIGIALVVKTIGFDFTSAFVLLGAFALQLGGVGLVRRGLFLRRNGGVEAALNSPAPMLSLGFAAMVAALFLTALVGLPNLIQAAGGAAFGALGLWLALFTSTGAVKSETSKAAKVAGIDMGDLRRQLNEAHGYVKRMRTGGERLSASADQAQVARIADDAEGVLEGILADPSDIRRARRFMATYLERAATSVEKFADAEAAGLADPHRQDFNATLDVIEQAFKDQQKRLDAEDQIDLEVQLDVLRKQMEREGL